MRIGIDARFYGGEQSKGLGRYTQKLIEYLVQLDTKNEYVVFLQQEGFDHWNIDNPRFTPVLAPYRWYTVAEQIFMPLKIRKYNVDLMHFPHFNVPLLYRKPFIATVHDLIINHFPTQKATRLGPVLYAIKRFAGQMVMKHAVKDAQKVITVSEFSKQDIAQYYGIDPENIVVTYEAADKHSEDIIDADEVLARYGVEEPYLLYVGNAYPHKNLENLVEAMHQLHQSGEKPRWKFVFVGKEDYFYARIKQEVWAHDLDDAIIFADFVPDADLPALYERAEAYIFPSLFEGFGLPPLEAMMYKTPVISSSASCMPEILGEAAEYFDPEDISAIIQSINHVLSDTQYREELVAKAEQQVKKYSWKDMTEQTLQVYEQQIPTTQSTSQNRAKGI